jgi:hypothetical protein
MTIEVLHAESFRLGAENFGALYVESSWSAGSLIAQPFGAGLQRLQWGRGTSPQGWAIRGNGAPNHTGFGIQTSRMWTPRTAAAGNRGVCFGFNRGGTNNAATIMQFGSEDGAEKYLEIGVNASSQLIATNGDGTLLGTSDYLMPIGVTSGIPPYVAMEIIPYLHSSDGWVKVYAEGELVLDLTTKKTSKGSANPFIGLIHAFLSYAHVLTDLVIHDAGGHGGSHGSAEAFQQSGLVDLRAASFAPAVAGSRTAGTAVGAATKLLAVNDLEHMYDQNNAYGNDDTRVDLDDTGLTKGLSFTTAPLPIDAKTVIAVISWGLVRKDDAGVNTGRLLLKSGSTETDGTEAGLTDLAPSTGYVPVGRVAMEDPDTDAPWLDAVDGGVAAADAAEIGYLRVT